MYISTESSSSTNTAIVLPMMISTTVVSTPPSNSGSVSASRVRSRRVHRVVSTRSSVTGGGDVDDVVGTDVAALGERHERGAGRGGGVGEHREA